MAEMFEPELLRELEGKARRRTYHAGETVIAAGRPVESLPIVLSGLVKVSRLEEDGRELFLYHINPEEGCAMSFTCCLERHASEVSAVAEEDTEVLSIPVEAAEGWTRFPSWRRFMMRTVRARFNELLRVIDLIAFSHLDGRLAAYLQEKASAHGGSLVNLSHERIAADLATSRVVVSRLLKKLERDGKVLLFRNQIKVIGEL